MGGLQVLEINIRSHEGFPATSCVAHHFLKSNALARHFELALVGLGKSLPTLFYQLEAVHLGDLLRLSVRPETKIILSLGFSRAVESAPDIARSVMLCRELYPISR